MAKVLLYNLGILTREGGAIRGILKSMGAEAVSVSRLRSLQNPVMKNRLC